MFDSSSQKCINQKNKELSTLKSPLSRESRAYDSNVSRIDHCKTARNRSNCWYICGGLFLFITIAAQVTIAYFSIKPLIYIFSNIQDWPTYDHGEEARGIFAIGNHAYGIIAIGQEAYGVIAIGQMAFGLITIGQVGCGVLFTLCQGGGSLGIAIAQGAVATKVPLAQIAFGLWDVGKVQIGFNMLSSWMAPYNEFVVKCTLCGKVNRTVWTLINGLTYPAYWPKEGKDWMATSIRDRATEDVIREYVVNCAKGGYHGLDVMSDDEKELIIQGLIKKKAKFKKIAMLNFPRDSQLTPV